MNNLLPKTGSEWFCCIYMGVAAIFCVALGGWMIAQGVVISFSYVLQILTILALVISIVSFIFAIWAFKRTDNINRNSMILNYITVCLSSPQILLNKCEIFINKERKIDEDRIDEITHILNDRVKFLKKKYILKNRKIDKPYDLLINLLTDYTIDMFLVDVNYKCIYDDKERTYKIPTFFQWIRNFENIDLYDYDLEKYAQKLYSNFSFFIDNSS